MIKEGPSWLSEALFLFAVVFGPLAFGAVEPWSRGILLAALYLLPVACAWTGRFKSGGGVKALFLPAAAVAFLGVLQWLNPHPANVPASLAPFTVSRALTGRAVVLWGGYACLLASAPSILSDRAAARRFVWTLLGLGVFVAIVGVVQRGLGNTAYYGLRRIHPGYQAFGPYTNRDHAASMLGMCACVGLGAASTGLLSFQREWRVGRLLDLAAIQALLYAGAALIFFGLFQTRSRGALLALAAALFVMGVGSSGFLPTSRVRWSARGFLLLALGGYLSFLWVHPDWLGGLLTSPGNSVAYRLSMDRAGWQMFLDFSIFGTGLGTVIDAFAPYKEALIDGVVDHVHNDWLELLIQTGAAGLSFCALAAGIFARRILRSWYSEPSREVRLYSAGAIAAAAFFLLHAFVEFSFQIPANAVLFFSILSLLGSSQMARNLPGRGNFDGAHIDAPGS